MTIQTFRKAAFYAALATISLATSAALAADHTVQMLNRGQDGSAFVFEPNFLRIEPGDTVHFLATTKGHNVETIAGMLPEGAEPFKGAMSEDQVVTFDKPGVYGLKCLPHYAMGMVMLIEVGTPANVETAKSVPQPGRAKPVFARLWDQI